MPNSDASTLDRQLRAVLAGFSQIKLAILFGSVAAGHAHPSSDLDIGVVPTAPLDADEKIQIIEALAVETGRPIDLVDLYHAPEPLLGQVLKYGRRVLGSDESYAQLVSRHLIEQSDFLPIRNRMLAERRRAWIGK